MLGKPDIRVCARTNGKTARAQKASEESAGAERGKGIAESGAEGEKERGWEQGHVDDAAAEGFADWCGNHGPKCESEHVEGKWEDGGGGSDVEVLRYILEARRDDG